MRNRRPINLQVGLRERILEKLKEYPYGTKYTTLTDAVNAEEGDKKITARRLRSIITPKEYKFLGAHGAYWLAPTIDLIEGSGYYIHRDNVQTQENVDNILAHHSDESVIDAVLGTTKQQEKARKRLEAVLEENKLLPYIFGGALSVMAKGANNLDAALREAYPDISPDIIEGLKHAFTLQLNYLRSKELTDEHSKLKYLKDNAKQYKEVSEGKRPLTDINRGWYWWVGSDIMPDDPIYPVQTEEQPREEQPPQAPDVAYPEAPDVAYPQEQGGEQGGQPRLSGQYYFIEHNANEDLIHQVRRMFRATNRVPPPLAALRHIVYTEHKKTIPEIVERLKSISAKLVG